MHKALKGWLIEHKYATDAASEDELKAALAKALTDGALTAEKVAELLTEKQAESHAPKALEDLIAKAVAGAMGEVHKEIAALKQPKEEAKPEKSVADQIFESIQKAMAQPAPEKKPDSETKAAELFGGNEQSNPRVKSPVEDFSTSKSAVIHPSTSKHAHLRGMPATYMGVPMDTTSQKDLAVIGAFAKVSAWSSSRGSIGSQFRPTERDFKIFEYALHEEKWGGYMQGGHYCIDDRKLTEMEVKTLLDDNTSGGLEAVPIVFDAAVITYPVLYGELFPLVNVVPLARGRRIEGMSITNVSWTSGTAEGSGIMPFVTDSMIAAFDNTIYPAVCAVEIGNDFSQDSPVAIGQLVTQSFGMTAMSWLDEQIAVGDGTSEPQGVFNASGLTDIGNPENGSNAVATVTDYENLLFGLAKQYRPPQERSRCVFVANDTSYKRSRAIKVSSTDQRRVFGMDHESYMLLEHPFKVQNTIPNTKCGFFNLAHYRLYRRMGMEMRVETGGRTLALSNTTLLVGRMRWGGKIELGGYGAFSDNWQT